MELPTLAVAVAEKSFITIPHQLLVMVVLVLFSSSTTNKKKWHILQE
jgi:hypothetical protein